MTINSEVIRMVKTSICRASCHVLVDFKITLGNEMKHLTDIICVKISQLVGFMPI